MRQYIRLVLPYIFLLLLLCWGVYVTLFFIGVDGHIVVLLKNADWQKIGQTVNDPFLRGFNGFIQFVRFLLERLQPFTLYAIASAVLYGGVVLFTVLGKGRLFLKMSFSALHIILLALFTLWLMNTALYYNSSPTSESRLIIEPTKQIYEKVPPETLAALKENFARLQDIGCLLPDPEGRTARGGAGVFQYKGWCMQISFFTVVLPPLLILLFFGLNFLVVGSACLRGLRFRINSRLLEFIVSLGLGAALLTALLWVLALFHVLARAEVWAFLLLIPVAGYRFTWKWIQTSFRERWEWQTVFHGGAVILGWLLFSLLAFNYLTVIRPFPIGWDDLGKYINLPRQLSVMNQVLPGIPGIQWEYLTALGFLLFGYSSTFAAVLAQQINWMAGLLAVLSVYISTKLILGKRAGLLAALFYYALPMVGHFSFADMKTENAIFFYGVLGLLGVLCFAFGEHVHAGEVQPAEHRKWQWLLLAGFFFAAGFATKPTIILMLFLGGVILTFALLGNLPGIGSMFLTMAVLQKANVLSFSGIVGKATGVALLWLNSIMVWGLLVCGVLLLFIRFIPAGSFAKRFRVSSLRGMQPYALAAGMLLLGFLCLSVPWMGYNFIQNKSMSIGALLKSPDSVTPLVRFSAKDIPSDAPAGSRYLPDALQIDPKHEMCAETARAEELDRYWGYRNDVWHYTGLPWRAIMNIDSQGYYLTLSPLLLLIPLLLFLPAFWRRERRVLRLLFAGTALYLLLWIAVGNGIPWYGIGLFLGFAVFIEAILAFAPNTAAQVVITLLVMTAFGTSFSFRMWQFDMQKNLYEYAWGKASAEVLQEMTIPDYDDVADRVLELSKNPERPYLYRMGTFISYFIPRNRDIIVLNDNQLGFFNCLNQEGDHALTLKRLHALGFHSIVFDTNTATIEKNPNGTLHKKVQRFLDFANDASLGIESVVNNPGNGIAYMVLPVPTKEIKEIKEINGIKELK